MNILILHGIEGYPGIHWQKWLGNESIKKKHNVIMPALPKSDHPDRKEWLQTALDSIKNIDKKNLVIIGHSLGVVTALDLIESLSLPIVALISVSGFSEDYGVPLNSYFLIERNIDMKKVNENIKHKYVIYGDNDPYVPQNILNKLATDLKVKPYIIQKGGHLNTNAGYTEFPLLLEIINKL